jgi:RNA-binding protein NOB1
MAGAADAARDVAAGAGRPRVLVLDTAALIAATDSLFVLGGLVRADGTPLPARAAGEAVEFVLVPEVAQEVRDPRARARLALLSESAAVREPTAGAMDAVIRFSKATGDYAALSRVDLKVLALACTLEMEENGSQFLRAVPVVPAFRPTETVPMARALAEEDERRRAERAARDRELAETEGWVPVLAVKNPGRPKGQAKPKKLRKRSKKKKEREAVPAAADGAEAAPAGETGGKDAEQNCAEHAAGVTPDAAERVRVADGEGGTSAGHAEAAGTRRAARVGPAAEQGEGDGLSESDDGAGWINGENLEEELTREAGGEDGRPGGESRIGCVTTDFAMQNVLLQMGLSLVSVDGRRAIRRVRRYVLRCESCTEVSRELERLFCGRCGNATLTRATFDVDRDGVARIFLSAKFKPRLRGTKYPIPMPRGGRNSKDLILCEDQIDPAKLRRAAKQRERAAVDVLDPDTFYNFGTKHLPHRPLTVGYGSRNPNEGRPSTKICRR